MRIFGKFTYEFFQHIHNYLFQVINECNYQINKQYNNSHKVYNIFFIKEGIYFPVIENEEDLISNYPNNILMLE